MASRHPEKSIRLGEQVALVALMISLIALCIDAMLPALDIMGVDLKVAARNDSQLVITAFFLGLAIGQMIYGPWSDSAGRKPAIYMGFVMFFIGTAICIGSSSFEAMLVGRFLQGLGAAGPRIVTIALIRDQYEGRAMARVMSMVMAVFIIMPAIAPAIGQVIMIVAGWRAIFWAFLGSGLVAFLWFLIRQPETLKKEARSPFSLRRIYSGIVETCCNPIAFGYTLASGLIFGAFVGYLVSAQAIFQVQYGLGDQFPLYFGILALAIGISSIVNSKLVVKYGMRFLSRIALVIMCIFSFPFLMLTLYYAGDPPLWLMMSYFSLTFLVIGVVFGNFNAMAMEPMGHIAGVAAAIIASLSTLISLPLGTWIGQSFSGTITPLVTGFALLGAGALLVMEWTEWRARSVPA